MSSCEREARAIAREIFAQLHLMGIQVVWSWGLDRSTLEALPAAEKGFECSYRRGGLTFFVNGSLHTGQVMIELTDMDDYTVSIGQLEGQDWKSDKVVSGVFFDQLAGVVDNMVETPAQG